MVKNGCKNPLTIKSEVKHLLQNETSGIIDYVEILNYPNLETLTNIDEQIIIAIAVQFKQARLIDNILLQPNGTKVTRIQ